jgi:F-type H+-transporting ATPase subunit epsilon
MKMFKLNLVTPDKKIVADHDLEEITLPGFAGELHILAGHAPLMTTLEPGILKYRLKGSSETVKVAISWGYCQVSSQGVNVLAESAVSAGEIELKVVKEHLKNQELKLTNETLDDAQWADTQHEIARLTAEIQLASSGTH